MLNEMYADGMDVAVTALRAELAAWLERVRAGEEVVVTERGVPVARLVPIGSASLIERLTADGVLARPAVPARPHAGGAARVPATGSVSALVDEQRR